MRKARRHRFAPALDPVRAYEDRPHPIGHGQTISQPYIVALMSEAARLEPPCKVLEPLLAQLRVGGRLVIPVGESWQVLEVYRRTAEGAERREQSDVRFVPMTGAIRREH